MGRPIDEDDVIKIIRMLPPEDGTAPMVVQSIKQLPTARAEIIACNQCVHYQQNHHYCELLDAEFSPNDYCSYAERWEDGNQ